MSGIDPREKNLPKWAQRELHVLRSRVAELQSIRDIEVTDATRVWSDGHSMNPRPIGDRGEVIRFDAEPTPGHWPDHLTVRMTREGRLDINGSRAVIIHPRASNSVEIELSAR